MASTVTTPVPEKLHPEALPIRLSVRALVAFSVCPPDILPLSPALMTQGRLAHTARQQLSAGIPEVPLHWQGTCMGLPFYIAGRMDLYQPDERLIEEIKLAVEPPDAPREEHRLQAVCYAHMLCKQEVLQSVTVRVSYADILGRVLASFDTPCTALEAERGFMQLLKAYAAFERRMRRHRKRRDASIAHLAFPYPHYRAGQRDMAAQVYTAIVRRKRLFAAMPTGTGKSAAVLYPAVKALGLQYCTQIFCLTARTTARLAMEQEFARMRAQGLKLKALTLNAREKVCPQQEVRCHPDHCPRARGHFERQPQALEAAMRLPVWDTRSVRRLADRHTLCPFELSLALSTLADAVIGDYNYAFDPRVRLQRVFERPRGLCVLVDEAHNLPDRARGMLSGTLEGAALRDFRRDVARRWGAGTRCTRAPPRCLGRSGKSGRRRSSWATFCRRCWPCCKHTPATGWGDMRCRTGWAFWTRWRACKRNRTATPGWWTGRGASPA